MVKTSTKTIEIAEYEIEFSTLNIPPSKIERAMGYKDVAAPAPISAIIRETLRQAAKHTEIRAGFKILNHSSLELQDSGFAVHSVFFNTGKIIAKPLRNISTLAIFVASAGKSLDEWSRKFFAKDDPLRGYIVDTLGSEIAEHAADWIEDKIVGISKRENLGCTNRYSPGYCGWSVQEQHKLFSFLPKAFCGISLTDTALMIPLKSVSGVIGIGAGIKKRAYPCRICDEEDCFRRRENLKNEIKDNERRRA